MLKNLTILIACLLLVLSPTFAEDIEKYREERERLIQLVLTLESDFGQTLRDYRLLQQDYTKLLARPQIPDQQGKVVELQGKLDQAVEKIREYQGLEAEARKGAEGQRAKMDEIRRKVDADLAGMKASLKTEQTALAVAQVKLAQLKTLEARAEKLEKLLRSETVERATILGQFKSLRGEKAALVVRVDELMKRASGAEEAQLKSAFRIGQLEEEAGTIKTQIAARDVEIKRLKDENSKGGAMMATLEKAIGEQAKLNKLLVDRETELGRLRSELLTEKKRTLDIPLLIKAREDLEGRLASSAEMLEESTSELTMMKARLAASARETVKLSEERLGLQDELIAANAGLAKAKEAMKSLQLTMAKNQEATVKAVELGKANELLVAERNELKKKFERAGKELLAARDEKKLIEAELAKNVELASNAKKLEQTNKALLAERNGLQQKLTESSAALAENQKEMTEVQSKLSKANEMAASAATLGKENQELITLREALRKELQTSKAALTEREGTMKSLQADLAKNQKAAMTAAKLADDHRKLATDLEKVQREYLKAQAVAKAMEGKLAETSKLAATAARLGQEKTELGLERDQLRKDLVAARASLEKSQEGLKVARAEMAKNRDLIASAEKMAIDRKEVMVERDTLLKELEVAQVELGKAQESMKLAEAKVLENTRLIESSKKLGRENALLATKSDRLNKELVVARAALTKAQADLNATRNEMAQKAKLAESAARLTTERDSLQKALADTRDLLAQAKVESNGAAQLTEEAARLKKDFAEVSIKVQDLEKEKIRLGGELARRDSELKKLRAEFDARPDNVAAMSKLEEEKKKLSSDLAAKTEDLKKARMDLGRLHLSSASMEKQLHVLSLRIAKIDPIRYAKGEADVKDQQNRVLTQVKEVLMLFPKARFEIVGHTCDLGSQSGNLELSRERSRSLLDYLVSQGVPGDRVTSIGLGDSQPAVPNTDETNRRKNRRVEVLILD